MLSKLREWFEKLCTFAKSVASERNGTGSASRVVFIIVASGAMLTLLLYVYLRRELPESDKLSALAKIIGSGASGYLGNQIKNAVTKDSTNTTGWTTDEQQ